MTVRMLNAIKPGAIVHSQTNGFSRGVSYEGGMPDLFVNFFNSFVYVECKADGLSIAFDKWSEKQERWWVDRREELSPLPIHYYISLWLYHYSQPPSHGKCYHKDADMWLVPPEVWLATKAENKSLRWMELAEKWPTYRLRYNKSSLLFEIPDEHPLTKLALDKAMGIP